MNEPNPFDGIAVLIPAYDPDDRLLSTAEELLDIGCDALVVVDDGSHAKSRRVFDALRQLRNVRIVEHAFNRGKGAALKSGFAAILDDPGAVRGVVTADADGQHLPADIARLAAASKTSPEAVILGCRSFGKDTPLRSLLGNRATAFLMTFVHGIPLTDTQTGLRYLPVGVLSGLEELSSNGYEFELECLIRCKQLGYELLEVPITTVYVDGNASSHFMPIADSIRIYRVLFRFAGSSIACFAIDIGLFSLLVFSATDAVNATIVARIVSGIVNFSLNKLFVFHRRSLLGTLREAVGYLALWMVLLLGSAIAVSLVEAQPPGLIVIVKILADISLFLLSYYAQSRFVFANRATRPRSRGRA